mgnify:FL=1
MCKWSHRQKRLTLFQFMLCMSYNLNHQCVCGIILINDALMHVRKIVEHTFSKMFALNIGSIESAALDDG